MQDLPLFSVLIANYNNGPFLQKAIDSVFRQSYLNWEIIIVDDGSTDDSPEIYDRYSSDTRFHIFFNGSNQGCGITKRKCVECASGTICGFLDPDDTLLPNALEDMVNVHVSHPNVAIVYSRCNYVDNLGNVVGRNMLLNLDEGETFFDYRWYGAMHFVTFKKSYYLLSDGINPKIMAGVDQDLYFKVEETGDIYVLDKFTYNYRVWQKTGAITASDNMTNLWFWNLEVRRDACNRRGLDTQSIILSDFSEVIEKISDHRIQQRLQKSPSYKLGQALLFPVIYLKSLFNK